MFCFFLLHYMYIMYTLVCASKKLHKHGNLSLNFVRHCLTQSFSVNVNFIFTIKKYSYNYIHKVLSNSHTI